MKRPVAVRQLPYVNNLLAVSVTALLAVASVFIFLRRPEIALAEALQDAAIFGFLTFLIDVAIIYPKLRRMHRDGQLPANPPVSRLLRATPRNPVAFTLLFALLFAAAVPLFNWLFFRFYQLDAMAFVPFFFFRTLYAVFFSAWMAKIIILRYVQPGAFRNDVPQRGDAEVLPAFPSVSTLREEFNSAQSDFGLNMILGVVLGGTRVGMDLDLGIGETRWLFIMPATRADLPISALVYAAIIYFMLIVPVVRNIRDMQSQNALPALKWRVPFFSALPGNPWACGAVFFLPALAFIFLFIWAVMTVMQFEVLNFFQYFFIRLACTKILTKIIVALAVLKYAQPQTQPAGDTPNERHV